MDWRKIIINAVTGLIVALISGVLVWSFTREPKNQERVFFQVENSGTFGSGPNKLTFFKIQIVNNGNAKSSDLLLQTTTNKNQTIDMYNITRSPSKPKVDDLKYSLNVLEFRIPRLLPTEYIYLYVAMKGSMSNLKPKILAKSAEFLVSEVKPQDQKNDRNIYLLFIQLFAFAMTPFAINYFLKVLYKRGNFRFFVKSRNNSGFLLLHSGLPKLAEHTLESAVTSGSSSPFELSNLALAKKCLGDSDSASKLLKTAEYWAKTKSEIGVVNFNKSLICGLENNIEDSLKFLDISLNLNEDIKNYINSSSIVKSLMESSDDIRKRIEKLSMES